MNGVIGRPAGGQQADHAIDEDPRLHLQPQGGLLASRQGHGLGHCRIGQRLPQGRARVDKRRAGQVQAHDLHQHLVGVGGAVKGAGARPVIGRLLGIEQGLPVDQALRKLLAHLGLVLIGQTRGHRAGRNEKSGQVAKLQRAHEQTGHDLVAHAQKKGCIKHVVRQAHHARQGNHIAREQRQLHAVFALGDAVTHRRHAAGDLCGGTGTAGARADAFRIVLKGLVGRQHVVVSRDQPQMGRALLAQHQLVGGRHGRIGMGRVGAAQAAALRTALAAGCLQHRQIGAAAWDAACLDARSHFSKTGMQAAHEEIQTATGARL